MSASLSSEPSSRQWWSKSKDSSRRVFASEKHSSSTKLNTLVHAIGLKSKKPPALAIQDHPSPPSTPQTSSHPAFQRPPSKSVSSSTRSHADSNEPRTPADLYHGSGERRGSLLTLSDMDPFAARGIVVPHSPSDPNRLSAYSNISIHDFIPAKKNEPSAYDRTSYASSSSLHHTPDLSPVSTTDSHQRKVAYVASSSGVTLSSHRVYRASLNRHASVVSSESTTSTWENLHNLAGTSADVERSRSSRQMSDPRLLQRAQMRPRGNTDASTRSRSFSHNEDPSVPVLRSPVRLNLSSPRVVVRQPSATRIGQLTPAPSSPPAQNLPAPPFRPSVDDDIDFALEHIASPSSSTVSLTSLGSSKEVYSRRDMMHRMIESTFTSTTLEHAWDQDSTHTSKSAHIPPTSPRTLKKSISHQTLTKKNPRHQLTPPRDETPERQPRKQRSFHHGRLPKTPIALSSHSSDSNAQPRQSPLSVVETAPSPQSVRNSSSGRKRLFSGSYRRPATSPAMHGDDDNRSVFSLPLEHERQRQPMTLRSSFWEEPVTTPPKARPESTQEYVPQHIMSPADMLKVEERLEMEKTNPALQRPRAGSIMSTSTFALDRDDESLIVGTVGNSRRDSVIPPRRNSLVGKSVLSPGQRPSTLAQHITPGPVRDDDLYLSPQSLPPPPRRFRPSLGSTTKSRDVFPAPSFSPSSQEDTFTPLPPPPRKLASAKRHLLMRKPSFLDIDDETDPEMDAPSARLEPVTRSRDGAKVMGIDTSTIDHIFGGDGFVGNKTAFPDDGLHYASNGRLVSFAGSDSFLDLARESFDTERNDD
ncbi:hypothetical protein FISHEDRAFT_70907 [Fistulina hepatica ATCC 64428]|uniref:Uncharacterized protein n=1 Tax=Fistulina hepatica ATCC 64428 TaxID=1128425 RepID=A0A0D7AIZ0_9AGAR|nr:hypothetical protein FISHEDRAFT_70907 [Fistulina hepatica ATCC 64428]